MEFAYKTDVGRIRTHNEDHVGIFEHQNGNVLALVADGMGGHLAGDVASFMTINLLEKAWGNVEDLHTPTETENWIQQAILDVNKTLYIHAEQNKECQGMGTTIVTALCTKHFVTIAHIGDSRCYLLNEHGFKKKTEDHSLVNELVRNGQITKDEAENHPRKNVLLRALGTERTIKVDVTTIEWEVGDYLLLCSDGLSNKLSEEKMYEIIHSDLPLTEKVNKLIQLANDLGGEDNISVAIVYNSPRKVGNEK